MRAKLANKSTAVQTFKTANEISRSERWQRRGEERRGEERRG